MKKFAVVFLLMGLISVTHAQTPPCNCCTENYRQFDFWIGNWEVYDSSGTRLGSNRIEMIQDSCALQEHWTGAQGSTGTSLSFYSKRLKRWHQTWVDKNGGVILMDGQFEDGKMILYTEKKYPSDDKTVYNQNKTTWYALADGRVHHVWQQTKDGGKTWVEVFNGFYKKK